MITLGSPRGTQLYGDSWALGVAVRALALDVGVILGQSNGTGPGVTDPVYGGVALATAHPTLSPVYWFQGAAVTTYDLPVGPAPWMIELMGSETSSPVLVNRAVDGADEQAIRDEQLPGSVADLAAIGIAPEDVKFCWLIHGEDPSQDEVEAADYPRDLEKLCRCIESVYPNALLPQNYLRSDTYGDYYAEVRAAQVLSSAARANRSLVDTLLPTPLPLDDTVHYEAGEDGHGESAARCWAAMAAS